MWVQVILGMDLLVPEPGRLWNIRIALDAILKKFIAFGFCPSQLRFNGILLREVGEQFCDMIGVAYDGRRFGPLLKAVNEIMSRL